MLSLKKFMTRNRLIILAGDVAIVFVSYLAAYYLRYGQPEPENILLFKKTIIPIIGVKIFVFLLAGLYTGPWRYTGVFDLVNIARASVLAFLVITMGMVFFISSRFLFSSLLMLDMIVMACLLSLFRLSIRILYSEQLLHGTISRLVGEGLMGEISGDMTNVLIYGANEYGEMLLNSLLSAQESTSYKVKGFVDDNAGNNGVMIHGVKNLGTMADLEWLIKKHGISEIMVASYPGIKVLRETFLVCQRNNVSCRVIPPYLDIVHQGVGVSQLKKIAIEDLLRRETVKIDYSRVADMIRGKRVMVTGAAGSIGRQLCLQMIEFRPAEIACVDIDENSLFYLEQDIRSVTSDVACSFYCANITNKGRMADIFAAHRPQMLFHAAAHKHVPLMESTPGEAILNNVAGTKTVADLAHEFKTGAFIFISSDKAVIPANVMGWTKRFGELYTQEIASESSTKFLSVRFGNVLGSNGSVVPIFRRQIENGGPVCVTHPDATRYFMTIPEAVLLILQSILLGEHGDIMILDMGEPVKIMDLAEDLIRIAGYAPGKDIEIRITGLRPGEKIHEELLNAMEKLELTAHPKISRVQKGFAGGTEIRELADSVLSICVDEQERAYELLVNGLKKDKIARPAI